MFDDTRDSCACGQVRLDDGVVLKVRAAALDDGGLVLDPLVHGPNACLRQVPRD